MFRQAEPIREIHSSDKSVIQTEVMNQQTIDELLARIPFYHELLSACEAEHAAVWLVGGCVRDLLLARDPSDIDLATLDAEPLARRLGGIINAHVVPMDQTRGIWRVAYASNRFFDICRMRAEDIFGDLRARDFTINAIAIRLPEADRPAEVVDPLHGVDDLRHGVLRQASTTAFHDDPARILRAFRFYAELPVEIEQDTWSALLHENHGLSRIAPERLMAEWWKLCAAPRAMQSFTRMDAAGVLTRLFPELSPAKGLTQNAYHHLDVWEHMRLAAENMAELLANPADLLGDLLPEFAEILADSHRRARLLFIALIHDIGKPSTRSEDDGRVHFYGHDSVGAALAGNLCRRLRMSREDTRVITTVIRHHLRPLLLLQAHRRHGVSDKAKLHLFNDAGDCLLDILLLGLADKASGLGPAADPNVLAQLRGLYHDLLTFYHTRFQPAIESPLLTGRELMHHLHMPPGPDVGRILQHLRDIQILGKLTTREEALQIAENLYESAAEVSPFP